MKGRESDFSSQDLLENSQNSINTNAKISLTNNNLLDNIKPLTKIRCPYCPLNCICKIDPCNYTISSDCSNNHNYNSDLIEFYNKSLLQQDENIKCDNCKGNENEKLELYYCYCGSILCKKCKDIHVNIYKNEKKGKHNCININ